MFGYLGRMRGAAVYGLTFGVFFGFSLGFGEVASTPNEQPDVVTSSRADSREALGERARLGPGETASLENFAGLPLRFEALPREGGRAAQFVAGSGDYRVILAPTRARFLLAPLSRDGEHASLGGGPTGEEGPAEVRMTLAGAKEEPTGIELEPLATRVSYFIGNDPKKWRRDVASYGKVRYQGVYDGIDVVYYGNQRRLEYDFVVGAGADPGAVRLRFEAAEGLELDASGDLVVTTPARPLRFSKPVAYQESHGLREPVGARYLIANDGTVGFALSEYDRSRPLVIDPVVDYATYLGGSGDDVGVGVVVGDDGGVYVLGWTGSLDLPQTSDAAQSALAGGTDAFVMKISPAGDAILFVTYLGGTSDESEVVGIDVDDQGNAYVTGFTKSDDFPVTVGAFQAEFAGPPADVFAAKLSADGTELLYATYIGGSDMEAAQYIVANDSGEAFVTGFTSSTDFPTTAGAFQEGPGGNDDAYVVKLNASGSDLMYATLLGGAGDEFAPGLALDELTGAIWVAGSTRSDDFPVTPDAQQLENGGSSDAFLALLDPTGSELHYATYFGESGPEQARDVALGPDGSVYFAGSTASDDLPVTVNAYQTEKLGLVDMFAARLDAETLEPIYLTYLGGGDNGLSDPIGDGVLRIAVDSAGILYIAGATRSPDAPVTDGTTLNGATDAYLAALSADGSELLFGSYIGGSGEERARNMVLGRSGSILLAGYTTSADFPIFNAVQRHYQGGVDCEFFVAVIGCDVFLMKIDGLASTPVAFTEVTDDVGIGGVDCFATSGHSLGVNWIDFDVDGWPDFFVACGSPGHPSKLFKNKKDGTFQDVSELLPSLPEYELTGSVAADYDNDGDVDLYVYTDNEQWVLGDMDHDGPPNLLLKNLLIENRGRPVAGQPLFEEVAAAAGVDDLADVPFGELPGHRTKSAGWVDYDRDGCVDLFVGHFIFATPGVEGNRDRLYRNLCDGTFEDVTASSGVNPGTDPSTYRMALAFIAAHLDQDLDPDMYVVNASLIVPADHVDMLYRNNGDGTFTELIANGDLPGIGDDDRAGMGIDVADIDLDGDWDIYISDGHTGNTFYLNNGDGTFADDSAPAAGVEAEFSWPVVFFDVDQDGYEDLYVGYANSDPLAYDFLYMNEGDGTFTDVGEQALPATDINRRGGAVADYDRDGDLDLLALDDLAQGLQLFRNDTVDAGNWLQLKLLGCESNRDAIGTVVKVTANSKTQMRQITGGMSNNSQNELIVHFGLGDADVVDELEVLWPSGIRNVFRDLEANQFRLVVEQRGVKAGLIGRGIRDTRVLSESQNFRILSKITAHHGCRGSKRPR